MERFRETKGITLVVLVITVIVLLILASISISTLNGNNSIINNAGDAKINSEIAEEKEIVEIATTKAIGKHKYGSLTQEGLQEQVNTYATEEHPIEVSEDDQNFIIHFSKSDRYYNVDSEGDVTQFEIIKDTTPGDITKDKDGNSLNGDDKPFEIWCIEDLVAFSNMVNASGFVIDNGTARSATMQDRDKINNKKICLMTDLNFKLKYSYADSKRTDFGDINDTEDGNELMTEMTTGTGFMPIGFGYPFYGEFEGNGKGISNIFIDRENASNSKAIGLFATIAKGNIKNLTVSGNMKNNWHTGGIVGDVVGSNLELENCINKVNITGYNMTGGIVGIAKGGDLFIKNCDNYGNIETTGREYAYSGNGGIIGCVHTSTGKVNIKNCNNYGKITATINANGDPGIGGILGCRYSATEIIIDNCNNTHKAVIGNNNNDNNLTCGGIVGKSLNGNITIKNCGNEAIIIGKKGNAGGIVGGNGGSNWSNVVNLEIYNSYSIGNITFSNGNAGGIIGNQGTVCAKNNVIIKNVYVLGQLIGNKTGAIIATKGISNNTEQTLNLTNVYYTNENALGSGITYSTDGSTQKTESQIKSEEFKDLLNSYKEGESDPVWPEGWKKWILGDKQYPIFE